MPATHALDRLTPREREILTLIGEGYSLPEIAEQLHRSIKTIETHRLTLGRKLQASNRVELARIAFQTGLVTLDSPEGQRTDARLAPDALATLRNRSKELQNIERISQQADPYIGPTYLRRLICALTEVLDIAWAGVCRLEYASDGPHAHAQFLCKYGELHDPMRYAIGPTPCMNTVEQGFYAVNDKLLERFPDDEAARVAQTQSYGGVRLDDEHGQPIGLLWLADQTPIDEPEVIEATLRFFVPRVAAELARTLQTDRELAQREEPFDPEPGSTGPAVYSKTPIDILLHNFGGLTRDMRDGVVTTDPEHRVTYCNPSFAQMLGYRSDELIGRAYTDLIPAQDKGPGNQVNADRQHAEGNNTPYDCEGLHRDGHTVPLRVGRTELFDTGDRPAGCLAIVTQPIPQPT